MTRALGLLWRLVTRLLPAGRRDWGEAVGAEIEHIPARREQVFWVMGGFRVVVRESNLASRLAYVGVVGVGFAGVLRYGWRDGPANPGAPIHRIALIATMSMLAIVPWISRRLKVFGPIAEGTAPRLVRAGAFLAMWATLPIMIYVGNYSDRRFGTCADCDAADRAQWHAERVSSAISGSVVIFVILALYAAFILRITAHTSRGTRSTLVIGASTGAMSGVALYALAPFGSPWHLANTGLAAIYHGALLVAIPAGPFLASMLAARRAGAAKPDDGIAISGPPDFPTPDPLTPDPLTQGVLAGVIAGAIGALLIAVLTIPTMVRFPHDVRLEWANPDPTVAHGTPFEVQMSVSDAAQRYEIFLVLGPLLGAVLGVGGGTAAYGIRKPEPDGSTPSAELLLGS
jgi:hypothetical protein